MFCVLGYVKLVGWITVTILGSPSFFVLDHNFAEGGQRNKTVKSFEQHYI